MSQITETADPTAGAGKGRILVVDDDRLVLATVTHGLAQAGYEVIDADNGDDAILLARQHRPELALLDIRMEGKTGFDVAEYLRDVAGVPFMFLSAFADEPTRAKVEALGAKAYLVKPLDVGQIVPTVDRVMSALRSHGGMPAPAAPAPSATPSAAAPSPVPAAVDAMSLAIGILMHRHTLSRARAWDKLQTLAADKGLSLAEQARRLVDAIEALADTDG
jgi:two-component system, response regulator PdtaR